MTSDDAEVQFTYRLVGPGWSEGRFAIGDRWVGLDASYLTDALGDLLRAVYGLVQGDASARVSWALEPGEIRWLFARSGSSVAVRVLSFSDDYLDQPADDLGEDEIDGTVPLRSLAEAVAAGARAVLEEHGESGYKERWIEHPFPTATLAELELALDPS